MPAARKMVEDNKLDPKSIAGSGRDGRVTKADVIAHMEGAAAARPAAAAPATSGVRRCLDPKWTTVRRLVGTALMLPLRAACGRAAAAVPGDGGNPDDLQ